MNMPLGMKLSGGISISINPIPCGFEMFGEPLLVTRGFGYRLYYAVEVEAAGRQVAETLP